MSRQLTNIDGDLAVGNELTVGGDMQLRGNATLDHNLHVKGWLHAPNVLGACKGLFASADTLNTRYPMPEDGWWAMVGNSVPAPIYRAWGGKWTATGEVGGNPTTKLDDPTALKNLIDANTERIQAIEDSKGKPGGIAPLDAKALIPESVLPLTVHDVALVARWDTPDGEDGDVNQGEYLFLSKPPTLKRLNDGEWTDVPLRTDVVYIHKAQRTPYSWDGSNMAPLAVNRPLTSEDIEEVCR